MDERVDVRETGLAGSAGRPAVLGALTVVLLFVARLIIEWSTPFAQAAVMWPGSALMLALLVTRARTEWDVAGVGIGGIVGALLWHALHGTPMPQAIESAMANVVASMGAFLLIRRRARAGNLFEDIGGVRAFTGACAASTIVAAAIGMGMRLATHPNTSLATWSGWYGSTLLGLLVVTPAAVMLVQPAAQRRLLLGARPLFEVVLSLGATVLVTTGVFLWSTLPLLFLVIPTVLLATFRLYRLGAVSALVIVAAIATYATARGHGPIASALARPADQLLLLQLFLASCFPCALPFAVMLHERELRAQDTFRLAQRFKSVVENSGEVIFQIDRGGRWTYLNPAWERLSGRAAEETIGRSWLDWAEMDDRAELAERVEPVLRGERTSARRVVRLATPGGPRWIELFVQAMHDQNGTPLGATGTLRDVEDRKRLEEHVATARRQAEQRAREATRLASTDELTGIANRRAFMRQLDREIAGAAEMGWPLSVAMFDVDHFKRVNDVHGHGVGDAVLQQIVARATGVVRSGDLIGRLGGEEFAILMPGATASDAAAVAERLRQAVAQPQDAGAMLPTVTVSVGVAERESQRSSGALLAAVDAALYAAKDGGRNRVRIAA